MQKKLQQRMRRKDRKTLKKIKDLILIDSFVFFWYSNLNKARLVLFIKPPEVFMIRNINSPAFEVTEAIKTHINSHLDKIENYHDRITRVDFFIKKEAHNFVAEINFHIPNKGEITIAQTSDDLYNAITVISNKALIKLKKIKEKQDPKHNTRVNIPESTDD